MKKNMIFFIKVIIVCDFTDRTRNLIGEEALARLKKTHIAVFGLGGVGSYLTEALARSGVGELTLIDKDQINVTNINRQLYALQSTIGQLKTEVARKRIADINPDCKVHTISQFYLPENREIFFLAHYDYICDAIDTVTAKIDLVLTAKEKNIPLISCMGTGNKYHPEQLKIADIYQTHTCPLARVMRHELKKRGISDQPVVFSTEEPHADKKAIDPITHKPIPASMSFVPAAAGLLMASKVICDIIKSKS